MATKEWGWAWNRDENWCEHDNQCSNKYFKDIFENWWRKCILRDVIFDDNIMDITYCFNICRVIELDISHKSIYQETDRFGIQTQETISMKKNSKMYECQSLTQIQLKHIPIDHTSFSRSTTTRNTHFLYNPMSFDEKSLGLIWSPSIDNAISQHSQIENIKSIQITKVETTYIDSTW